MTKCKYFLLHHNNCPSAPKPSLVLHLRLVLLEAFSLLSSPSQTNPSQTMNLINNKHTLNSMKCKYLHQHWFHSKLFKWDHSICKTSCLIYQFKYACFHTNHRCPIIYKPLLEFDLHCCLMLELDCLYNNTSFWLFIPTQYGTPSSLPLWLKPLIHFTWYNDSISSVCNIINYLFNT
jgi:hypothetical protein